MSFSEQSSALVPTIKCDLLGPLCLVLQKFLNGG